MPNDLLLLDRGYPAYWIFNLILSRGGNFCAGISTQWKIVQRFPQEIFKDLYHLRWPVEVDYLFMKERIQVGNFSGKSSLSVYQDFHSKVFTKNLIWVLASPAQDTVKQTREEGKQDRQLNMTQAISKSKEPLAETMNILQK